jgi:hypothetical protein
VQGHEWFDDGADAGAWKTRGTTIDLWPPFNRQRRKRRETGSSRDDCYGGVGDVDFDCHTDLAEKPGGVLRMPMITSPASMSINEDRRLPRSVR